MQTVTETMQGTSSKSLSRRQAVRETRYDLVTIVILFFVFAFAGWICEVIYFSFLSGSFVNRGFFHGPWLPIYGFGGVLMTLALKRFANRPVLVFLFAAILAGSLEYWTSYFLELKFDTTWWDYSENFMNVQGRICLQNLVVFGVAGCFGVGSISPWFNSALTAVDKKTKNQLCVILLVLFISDVVISITAPNMGDMITSYPFHTVHN